MAVRKNVLRDVASIVNVKHALMPSLARHDSVCLPSNTPIPTFLDHEHKLQASLQMGVGKLVR